MLPELLCICVCIRGRIAPTRSRAGELFILGTAHVSEKSATDVKRAIELCKPDVLLVELCRARAGLLLQRAEPPPADDAPAPELGWADIKRTLAERQGLSGIFQLLLTHSTYFCNRVCVWVALIRRLCLYSAACSVQSDK